MIIPLESLALSVESPAASSVVALGFFDGVHLGHVKVLHQAVQLADSLGMRALVFTFANHPASIIRPFNVPKLLNSQAQRWHYLQDQGLDCVFAHFNQAFSVLSAQQFVEEVLVKKLRARHLVVGPNYNFGMGAKGTPQMLQALAPRYGFTVHVVEPLQFNDELLGSGYVSSSLLRKLISSGQVAIANQLMGRPYTLLAPVFEGRHIGRTLQAATANLVIPSERVQPQFGVYAVRVLCHDKIFPAAAYCGTRPTFNDGNDVWTEVHFLTESDWLRAGGTGKLRQFSWLDPHCQLYNEELIVEFISFLRSERCFASPEDLGAQIAKDIRASFVSLGCLK